MSSHLRDETGRTWRSVQDTADASQILRGGDPAWAGWRRGQEYYNEGALLWLEADVRIRQLTGGRKSLDDFAALFFGNGGTSDWAVVPYRFEDVMRALNAVAPYDWAGFWRTNLDSHSPDAVFAGLDATGYRFAYRDEMIAAEADALGKSGYVDARASLGFLSGSKGDVPDVRYGSPAFLAGMGPGDEIKTVNGAAYSGENLRKAIRDAKDGANDIVLGTVRDGEDVERRIAYHGGERFPWLVRDPARADLLGEIVKARGAR